MRRYGLPVTIDHAIINDHVFPYDLPTQIHKHLIDVHAGLCTSLVIRCITPSSTHGKGALVGDGTVVGEVGLVADEDEGDVMGL